MSGKVFNESQESNNSSITLTLETSHFEISGNSCNFLQCENVQLISSKFELSHSEIFVKNLMFSAAFKNTTNRYDI